MRRLKDNRKTDLEYLTRECVYRIHPAPGQGQVTRASEYGNEALYFVRFMEFLG
jgi:hypothetical protein